MVPPLFLARTTCTLASMGNHFSGANTMKWASLVLGMAVGLPWLATGCAGTDFFGKLIVRSDPLAGDRVLAGSLDEVAISTHSSLVNLGLKADIKPGTESYRIESETRSGLKFQLVLTRVPSAT